MKTEESQEKTFRVLACSGSYLIDMEIVDVYLAPAEAQERYSDWCKRKIVYSVKGTQRKIPKEFFSQTLQDIQMNASKGKIFYFGACESRIIPISAKQEAAIFTEIEEKRALQEKKRKEKEDAKSEKVAMIFAKAKETGEKQLLQQFAVDCEDENEECNTDIVCEYAHPNGTTSTTQTHTY